MTEPSDTPTSPDSEQETMHDVSGDQAQQPAEQVDPIQAAKDARAERHGDEDQAESTAGDVQTNDEDQDDDGEDQGGTSGQ